MREPRFLIGVGRVDNQLPQLSIDIRQRTYKEDSAIASAKRSSAKGAKCKSLGQRPRNGKYTLRALKARNNFSPKHTVRRNLCRKS